MGLGVRVSRFGAVKSSRLLTMEQFGIQSSGIIGFSFRRRDGRTRIFWKFHPADPNMFVCPELSSKR